LLEIKNSERTILSKSNEIKSTNSSRLFGLDVARLFAMLMMVQGHTIYCLLEGGIIASGDWYWTLWSFVRGFTAPVFLMVSGAVHIFANKRDEYGNFPNATAKKRIKICLILFVVGYLLQFPANTIYDLPFINIKYLYSFFKVNVLQMFAASLILLTILFKLTKSNKQLATVAFILGNVFILISHFSLQVDWFEHLPIPLASFFSMKHRTIFPLFPFTGYLLIGVFLGYLLQNTSSENRNSYIIKNFILIGIPYVIIGFLLDYWYVRGGSDVIGIATISMGVSVYRVGVAMIMIAAATFFSKFLLRFQPTISMFSKKALFIYVIHLLIIYGSPISPGLRHFFFNVDVFTAFYCAFFVIFFSLFLVYLYDLSLQKEGAKHFYKYLIVAFLIYRLLI